MNSLKILVLLGSLVASPACGTNDAGVRAGAVADEPVYVVYSTIDTPDGRTGYYATTPSIEGDVAVDVTQGLEEAGGGQLYAPPGEGYFLLGGGESPTFTRYALDQSGLLAAGATVSFADFGVDEVWSHMIFADAHKAYFLDVTQLQIISFDPTTMEVLKSIPVDDFECEEKSTQFGMPIEREDGYYFPRSCWDLDVTSRGASLVHLDPSTDEVTVTHDQRCMGMHIGFMADSGDAYWFSDHDASAEWAYQQRDAPHDCALRLRAGENTFDVTWDLDLTTRTGGAAAVAAVPASNSKIWLKVFDESAMPTAVPVDEIDWTVKAWRWALLDVESDDPVEVDLDGDLVVSYGFPILVDDRSFSPATTFSTDGDETTLMEITEAGVKPRARVAGELRKVVRLR